MRLSRRGLIGATIAGTGSAITPTLAQPQPARTPDWRRGFDNQRVPDLGDGRFLNPLMSGDHPDPTILKVEKVM